MFILAGRNGWGTCNLAVDLLCYGGFVVAGDGLPRPLNIWKHIHMTHTPLFQEKISSLVWKNLCMEVNALLWTGRIFLIFFFSVLSDIFMSESLLKDATRQLKSSLHYNNFFVSGALQQGASAQLLAVFLPGLVLRQATIRM